MATTWHVEGKDFFYKCLLFIISSLYFYCPWCIEKDPHKIMYIYKTVRILIHFSLCVLNFMFPVCRPKLAKVSHTTLTDEEARFKVTFRICSFASPKFSKFLQFASDIPCNKWDHPFIGPRNRDVMLPQVLTVEGFNFGCCWLYFNFNGSWRQYLEGWLRSDVLYP